MRKIFSYLSYFLSTATVVSLILSPQMVAAAKKPTAKKAGYASYLYIPKKTYKDEKVVISNAASRCNTPSMRAAHAKNLAKAEADGKLYGLTPESVSTTESLPPVGQAYKTYLNGLALAWDAMTEPYCGFGAFGTSAANKSYTKSVTHTRARFLAAAKASKIQPVVVAKK